MWFLVFAMLFGASLVPWYFVIKATGLMDSIWAVSYTHLDVYKRQGRTPKEYLNESSEK